MKKKFLIIAVLIVSIFTFEVNAKQFYVKEKLNINEQQEHSIFVAGTKIDVSSFVDGATFVAGEEINLTSSQDIIFAAGEEIKIKDAYTKDAFIAGTEIEITNSQIRDVYAFAEEIEINSEISHNAYLAGTKVKISSKIMGNVHIAAEEIIIEDSAEIKGTLEYPKHAYIRIADEAVVENTKTYAPTEADQALNIKIIIQDFIMTYLSLLVTGFVLLMLFKKRFDNLEKEELSIQNIAVKTGLGFLVLITVPIAVIIAMCSLVGMPLSLIVLALYIILIYISIIPSGYFIAYKLLNKKVKNEYLLLSVGVLAIKLLELVPIIGGFIVFISLCFGIWTSLGITKKKTTK